MRKSMILKFFFVVLVLNVFRILFALEISPSLVYQIETQKYKFSYSFFVKNDIPGESLINIEIIDFITDGKKYTFDDPEYKYSLRKYVSLAEKNFKLMAREQKEIIVNFDVPTDFQGASGVFALKISQESVSGGQIQIRLNYIVPFFVRFKNIPVFQSIKINSLTVRNLFNEPDENYGNAGSLITLEMENNGNITFIPKGNITITSRDLKTVIAEIPIDSFDLVIFPEKKTFYTFFTPYIFPSGIIDVSLYGKSYGQDFQVSASLNNELKIDYSLYSFDKDIIFFSKKNSSSIQTLNLNNLSPVKESITLYTDNEKISFLPKKVSVYPYNSITFSVRVSEKNYDFNGDKIYPIKILGVDGKERLSSNFLYIVLRGDNISPYLNASLENINNQSVLVVKNAGDCIIEFNVFYSGKIVNDNPIKIFPSQTINLEFGRIVQSSNVSIEYNPYGEYKKFKIENLAQ